MKKHFRDKYDVLDLDVVIYIKNFSKIGGIETWTYYTCKKYNVGQITVLYNFGDKEQLERLEKVANLIQYTGQEFHCNKIIFGAPVFIDMDLYRMADKRYLINHVCYGDANNQEVFEIPELDGNFAVSDYCRDSCKKRMLGDIVTLYNPVEIDKPEKVLKLITACRWAKTKGNQQMLDFADRLDKKGIRYIWFVFTDEEPEYHSPNMVFMKPRLDLSSIIAECDWGIEFSKLESYGLFPTECLILGTPVVLTDLPVFREIGISEDNALFYDWELNGPDVSELLNVKKVKYTPPSSDELYKELLGWVILKW